MEYDVLAWDTLEHQHYEKSPDWYWSLGIIAVSAAILCILFNNILFALFILLAALVSALHATKRPNTIHIEIQPRGIVYNTTLYDYDSLESFWIEEGETADFPRILLKSKKFFMPLIIIPISEEVDPEEVRHWLVQHIAQVEHHESAAHRLLEYFGF